MTMRERNNGLAEKLWYVIKEAVQKGVTVQEFQQECKECWVEVHREAAEFAQKDWEGAPR